MLELCVLRVHPAGSRETGGDPSKQLSVRYLVLQHPLFLQLLRKLGIGLQVMLRHLTKQGFVPQPAFGTVLTSAGKSKASQLPALSGEPPKHMTRKEGGGSGPLAAQSLLLLPFQVPPLKAPLNKQPLPILI